MDAPLLAFIFVEMPNDALLLFNLYVSLLHLDGSHGRCEEHTGGIHRNVEG